MSECNLCNKGLSPICTPSTEFQPNVIQCPKLSLSEVESPLCDLFPTVSSITDFLINLPILLLFVVSLPVRFLYCMAYQFLINADDFIDFFIYYLIYTGIDFITLPFIYFVLGFNSGLKGSFNLPSQLYGFLNACFVATILETVYKILGDVFYAIGFAIGFLSSVFYKLYNFIIDIVCYITYLTLSIGVAICINLGITQISTCQKLSFQPFGFLQGFVCNFFNCKCALGNCPSLSLILPLELGCTVSDCGGENVFPMCMQYNLGITFPSSETSENGNPQSSQNNCSIVSELSYCQDCLESNQNCNKCNQVLSAIEQNSCTFKCCNYSCLMSKACYECSESGNNDACQICFTLTKQCYVNNVPSNLPCYSEYMTECTQCFKSFASEPCQLCGKLIDECKQETVQELCPPVSSEQTPS